MNRIVLVRNRQPTPAIDLGLLRKIARSLLRDLLQLQSFEVGILVVAAAEMTRLNETFLRHRGSTDVLAFDYGEPGRPGSLRGDILVCVDQARSQAARFHTTWQSELVRYVVHGTLHLCGFDDHARVSHRKMKREENRLLKELAARFSFVELEKTPVNAS